MSNVQIVKPLFVGFAWIYITALGDVGDIMIIVAK
jgi:hypothetical protein